MNHFSSLFSRALDILIFLLVVLATGSFPIFGADDVVEVTGTIASPGDYSTYSFSVTEESFFYFDSLTNATGLRLSLSGPSGRVVSVRSARAMRRRAGAENILLTTNQYRAQDVMQSSSLPSSSVGTIPPLHGRCETNTQNLFR